MSRLNCQTQQITFLISQTVGILSEILALQLKLMIRVRRSNAAAGDERSVFELVELSGYFRKWVNPAESAEAYASDDEEKVSSIKSNLSVQNAQVIRYFLW